jgi:hypothetical protein
MLRKTTRSKSKTSTWEENNFNQTLINWRAKE